MCNECCRQVRGWCCAFTAIEVALSVLQVVLLTVLITFLTFIILHLTACSSNNNTFNEPAEDVVTNDISKLEEAPTSATSTTGKHATVAPDIACTWTPSAKTQASIQYFELGYGPIYPTAETNRPLVPLPPATKTPHTPEYGVYDSDEFDGVPANDEKNFIMALVKLRPPDDITFGCTLTIISEVWTLTAASCIESIEEVDSLDSFVMMENFGEKIHGKIHTVSDVLIHPEYQGTNKTYDVVALKSEDKLPTGRVMLKLPTMLDYLLIAIGERLTVLGFGKFRSIDADAFSRGARAARVHALPDAQCAEAWGARHLAGGGAARTARCGPGALCAGPLAARAQPCNYCAGTPLLRARRLLGLMSAPGACGAPCEPALYVNLAAVRDWLDAVLAGSISR